MRVQRIFCPVDLTTTSDQALRYSFALAKAYDARLFVFHCVRTTATETNGDGERQLTRGRRRLQQEVKTSVAADVISSVQWQPIVSRCEDDGDSIVQEAARLRADLIVMRSRRRPHRAALLGSTAEEVCRTASCPVLVCHSEERDWIDEKSQIQVKRVLVAYDFSDLSEVALKYAISVAQEYQAELHLLHVLPPSVRVPEISWEPYGQQGAYHTAARRLQKSVPAEAQLWCQVRHVVSEGQPYREILNYADSNGIDLICIGAHGAGFGMRTLFGSNVDRVLRQAPCPVLVARPLKPMVTMQPTAATTIEQNANPGSVLSPKRKHA